MRSIGFTYTSFVMVAGLLVLAMGCGKANDGSGFPPGGVTTGLGPSSYYSSATNCPNEVNLALQACPAGMSRIAMGGCLSSTGTFADRCWYSGGTFLPAANGKPELCRVTLLPIGMSAPASALITAGSPCGTANSAIALPVRVGDRLTVRASGGYDVISASSFFQSCNPLDHDFDLSGNGRTYGGYIEGLVGSDGIEMFNIGGDLIGRTITHNGQLHLGFNFAPSTRFGCTVVNIQEISLEHCEDTSGNTYSCQ